MIPSPLTLSSKKILKINPFALLGSVASFKVEKVFLCLAISFGTLFIFLSAPFQAPDEYIHFFHAYEVSKGHLVIQKARLPKSVKVFAESVSPGIAGNDQNRQSKKLLLQEFSRRFTPILEEEVDIANIAVYSPVPYLPQAAGIFLGRMLFLPPIMIFYLARLLNLTTWIILTYLAIRITPIHPRLFAAIGLMPMTLFIAASVSPDAFTNGICFLWIAFVLRLAMRSERPMKSSDWVALILLVIPVALCKSIYVIIAGLVLLLPLRQGKNWKIYLAGSSAVILIALLAGILWLNYSVQYGTAHSTEQYNMPTVQELSFYFFQRPDITIQVFSSSIQQYFWGQAKMMIGVLGWVDAPLYSWVYPVYYLLLVFTALFESHPKEAFQLLEKILLVGMAFFSYFLMMVILFNPKVDIGNGKINMPQGRYYIPFAPFYFLPFSQNRWALRDDSPVWALWIVALALIFGVATRILLRRYYAV